MSLPGFLLRKLAVAGILALLILFASRTAAEKTATLEFLKEFAAPIPELLQEYEAAGDDYCSTEEGKTFLGVTCAGEDNKVTIDVTAIVDEYKPETYVYPTLTGTYNRKDVDVVKFNGTGFTSVSGALPSNWPELSQLQDLIFGHATFCGCVPESYKDNAVFEAALEKLGSEKLTKLNSMDCASANACMSDSQKENTLAFLGAVGEENPEIGKLWDPNEEDYCNDWELIECDANGAFVNVNTTLLDASTTPFAFRFPEVPEGVDPAEVMVQYFDGAGLSSVRGPFPASYADLTQLSFLRFPTNTLFCGCLAEAVKENEVLKTAIETLTEENQLALSADDCSTANACPASQSDSDDDSSSSDVDDSNDNSCLVAHCSECRGGSLRLCNKCTIGYILTPLNECKEGVFGPVPVLFSTAFAAIICAAVLVF